MPASTKQSIRSEVVKNKQRNETNNIKSEISHHDNLCFPHRTMKDEEMNSLQMLPARAMVVVQIKPSALPLPLYYLHVF
jgi:hypothetical protein